MLLVTDIRENKERIISGLKKRNISDFTVLDQILEADDNRKKTQFELDNLLAESNQLSKQIGELYKNVQAEKANQLKAETSSLKDKSKKLQETLNQYKVDLEEMLFQIPN